MPKPPVDPLSRPIGSIPQMFLDMNCGRCGRSSTSILQLLVNAYGPDVLLRHLVPRLVCKTCGQRPLFVYLQEKQVWKLPGTDEFDYGWRVTLRG
jgi:hypothetical protein